MRCSPGPLDPHAHTLLQIGLMNIRNEEKRIGWAACALARHVDAIVARDDDSDDGTGMCPLISAVQTPQVPDCPSFPPLLSSGGAVASAAALRIRAQPHPCTQALEVSRSTPRPLRRPLSHSHSTLLPQIRNRAHLLEAGRSSGGTHFIFVDADEILTDNYRKNNRLRELMCDIAPPFPLCCCLHRFG
jgi:hypothetical protein